MAQKNLNRRMKDAGFTDPKDPMYALALQEIGKLAQDEKEELRIKRELDAEEKRLIAQAESTPDTCWDDLNAFHSKLVMVFAGYGYMARAMKDPRLLSFVNNRRQFIELCQLLKRDLDILKAELAQIYALHAGRTGGRAKGKGGDRELMAALEANEHYQMWLIKHDQLCERTSAQIRAMIQDAEVAMIKADKDAADAQAATDQPEAVPA